MRSPPDLPQRGRWRVALALALLPATGCPSPCVGPGCEQDFTAALAGVLRGSDQLSARPGTSPLDATWAQVEGSADLGPDWDLCFAPDGLLIGSPEEGAVRRVRLERSRQLPATDAIGVLSGGGDRFGASLDSSLTDSASVQGSVTLLVGAPGADKDGTGRDEGAVYLFRDLDPGWEGPLLASDVATARLSGLSTGGALGETVRLCADIDGDGLSDWLMAAPLDDSGDRLAGAVFLVLSTDEAHAQTTDDLDLRWTASGVGTRAGSALSCADDLTGDGVADLLVGAPFADGVHEAEGAVYLLSGGPELTAGDLSTVATATLNGRYAEAWLGTSIATGDLDNDRDADLAVGAPGANGDQGEVLVWDGATLQAAPDRLSDYRISGMAQGDDFGRSLAIDDLDGDGVADLLVGAPLRNPTHNNAPRAFDSGTLYIFHGSVGFRVWRSNMTAQDAAVFYQEERQYLRTGQQVRTGDFDADGLADIALLHRFDPTGG